MIGKGIYNLSHASEVVSLIVGDFDAADAKRDIIVETQTGYLQRVSVVSSAYLPLQYLLLFTRGEDCYRDYIPLNEISCSSSQRRNKVTMREFFVYRIQQRENEEATLLLSKRLIQ